MAVLDPSVKPLDLKTLQRMVDVAYDRAVEGTMEGMAAMHGKSKSMERFEGRAFSIVNAEVKHWRSMLKIRDRYCLETLQKEVPCIFEPELEHTYFHGGHNPDNCSACFVERAEFQVKVHKASQKG